MLVPNWRVPLQRCGRRRASDVRPRVDEWTSRIWGDLHTARARLSQARRGAPGFDEIVEFWCRELGVVVESRELEVARTLLNRFEVRGSRRLRRTADLGVFAGQLLGISVPGGGMHKKGSKMSTHVQFATSTAFAAGVEEDAHESESGGISIDGLWAFGLVVVLVAVGIVIVDRRRKKPVPPVPPRPPGTRPAEPITGGVAEQSLVLAFRSPSTELLATLRRATASPVSLRDSQLRSSIEWLWLGASGSDTGRQLGALIAGGHDEDVESGGFVLARVVGTTFPPGLGVAGPGRVDALDQLFQRGLKIDSLAVGVAPASLEGLPLQKVM